MTAVTYTAKRSIIPGHSLDSVYSLSLRMIDFTRAPDVNRTSQRSLGLVRETLFWGGTSTASITIGSYTEQGSEYDGVIEFLDSVSTGISFAFDRWGVAGAPANPQSCVLVGDYSIIRHARRAGDGNDLMRFSFSIEFS